MAHGHDILDAKDLVELQMVLTNSSISHEYIRKEYENAKSFQQRQELLEKMEIYKEAYFEARLTLQNIDPSIVEDLEKDLMSQKQTVMIEYNA